MATNITDWLPYVMPAVPGCPRQTIINELRWALRDFCEHTLLWEEKLSAISSVAVEGTDIAFVDSGPDTITSTSTDFDAAGFTAGQIIVTDDDDNPGPFTLATVAANTLTLDSGDSVTAVTAGTNTTVGAATYSLSSSNGDIVGIDHATYYYRPMTAVSESWLDEHLYAWRIYMQEYPEFYLMNQDRYIQLVYCPDEALTGGLQVWANLKPAWDATTVEDWLFDDHVSIIADGAVYRLLRIPKKPWSDRLEADIYQREYIMARDNQIMKKRQGLTKAETKVHLTRFC